MELVLEPKGADRHYWLDLWRYRDLFFALAKRDVAVRYKQTVIGIAWAVLRPLLTVAILTLVFSRIARLPSEGAAPYALMVLAGMLPWMFFSSAFADASSSLIANSALVGKVYFPRLIIPVATIVVSLVDLVVSLALLAAMMAWYGFWADWRIVMLPFFALLAFLAALGPSLWTASLNVKYRDFRYLIPFVVQFGLYVSPVGFSTSVVPEEWRLLYSLNPMVGIIDGFRWCILAGNSAIYWPSVCIACAVTAALLWVGVARFRRMERTMADLL